MNSDHGDIETWCGFALKERHSYCESHNDTAFVPWMEEVNSSDLLIGIIKYFIVDTSFLADGFGRLLSLE